MSVSHVYADNGDATVKREPGVSVVHVDNMPQGGGGGGAVDSVNGKTGTVVLTASDVGALPSSTSIPTKTSDLTNDSGFITSSDIPPQQQSDWNETDVDDPSYIQNKPTIPAAQINSDWNASSGVAEILNKPTIPTATSDLTNDSGFITSSDVPGAQEQADWNESNSSDPAYIKNKPTIPSAQVNSDWNASSGVAEILNKPSLATVATSGDYDDLQNKPTIPAAQVNSDWNAASGVAQILNKPNLATVATSGSYNDLSNTPTINNVPAVTSSDDGKILTASYSGGVGSYAWATASGGSESVKVLEVNNSNIYDSTVVASIVQFVSANAENYPIIINQVVDKGQSSEYSKIYYLSAYKKTNSHGISGDYPEFSFAEGYDYNYGRFINYLYFYPQDDGEGNISYTINVDTDYFDYSGNTVYNYGTTSLNAYQLDDTFNGNEFQNKHIFLFVRNTDFSAADQALLFTSGTESSIMLDGLQIIKDTTTLEVIAAKFYGVVSGVAANSKYMVTATFDYSADPWVIGTKTLTVEEFASGGGSSPVEILTLSEMNTKFPNGPNDVITYLRSGKTFIISDADRYYTLGYWNTVGNILFSLPVTGTGTATITVRTFRLSYFNMRFSLDTYVGMDIENVGVGSFASTYHSNNYSNGNSFTKGTIYYVEVGRYWKFYEVVDDFTATGPGQISNDTTNFRELKVFDEIKNNKTDKYSYTVPSGGTIDLGASWNNKIIELDTTTSDPISITNTNSVLNVVLQWTASSSTTLPTMPSSYHASASNPSALTVGNTYQLSLINNCYSIVEFA